MGDGHVRKVHPYVTGDLFASYNLDSTAGRTVIAGGINNVIDADPATIYNHGPDGDPSGYDFIGRFFYLRLTQAF
jgi:outer membrane receptor protein involved in Fe transport